MSPPMHPSTLHRRAWMSRALALAGSGSLATGLLTGPARLWAMPGQGDARLLVVYLRGGYDALSLLVPSERSFYAEARPGIAIPAPGAAGGALGLTADWALHPAPGAALMPLVQAGQAVFVPFAGSQNLSRSHFETQDSMELGLAAGVSDAAVRDLQSGFLNRLAVQLGGAPAIGFTEQLPLALRGAQPVANLAVRAGAGGGEPPAVRAALQALYRDHPLQSRVDSGFALRDQMARQVAEEQALAKAAAAAASGASAEMLAASRNAVSARGFELEARRIARLMRDSYRLGFVDVGGWDTHVNQGAATGQLASRLQELAGGLAALPEALGPEAWRRTVVVVLSEFGRTTRENGNRGTDHGHGSVYWVLGGGLAAGQAVRGEQLPVSARHMHQGRDLPVLNDYRGLLAGLMQRQFGLSAAALSAVFPGAQPVDLRLL